MDVCQRYILGDLGLGLWITRALNLSTNAESRT